LGLNKKQMQLHLSPLILIQQLAAFKYFRISSKEIIF